VSCVGGGLGWLRHERFQRGYKGNGVPRGHVSATRGRARVASCFLLGAVQLCVNGDAGRVLCAQECDTHAARSGRPGRVGSAWSGWHAR
jgi:hypothetical protein